VPKRMAVDPLGDARRNTGVLHGFLQPVLVQVMSSRDAAARVERHTGEVRAQRLRRGFRQRHDTILGTFGVAHDDLTVAEIDVLDSEAHDFHQAHARPVEETGHEPSCARELVEQGADLLACQYDRQPPWSLRAHERAKLYRTAQNFTIEEDQRAQRLVLSAGSTLPCTASRSRKAFTSAAPSCRGSR